jgi:predicted glycosyltransferase
MKILFDITHPFAVHLYKNFIWQMEKQGHQIKVLARDKDVTLKLLKYYSIEHQVIGSSSKGFIGLLWEWLRRDIEIYKIASKMHPDILMGVNNPCLAHSARLSGGKYINLTETKHARLENLLTHPFTDLINTTPTYGKDFGKKHVRYDSYPELAYLHTNYFKPDPSILDELGLSKGEICFVIRFVAWRASHDLGKAGLSMAVKRELVDILKRQGRVFISAEDSLPDEFEQYRITLTPEKIHDLLYFARLYIGEGATMASEAAVLGTPAIYVNPLKIGYLGEQENKYGLVYNFHRPNDERKAILDKVKELLSNKNLKEESKLSRGRLLNEKCDLTKFMIEQVGNLVE